MELVFVDSGRFKMGDWPPEPCPSVWRQVSNEELDAGINKVLQMSAERDIHNIVETAKFFAAAKKVFKQNSNLMNRLAQ